MNYNFRLILLKYTSDQLIIVFLVNQYEKTGGTPFCTLLVFSIWSRPIWVWELYDSL